MTTATPATAAPLAAAPTTWPIPIPIIGGTGEYASGKTLFGLTMAPGPRTLVYDTEKSSESYAGLGFTRIDVPREMVRRHPKGYKPIDTFNWWRDHVRSIEPGQYAVIALDTASEIESGAVEWVRANPGYFGKTAVQYVKMSGLLWGDMKELWKAMLSDLASRCETFYFTVHLGVEFAGDKPTGKKKPKGKSTLMELASLFLHFERKADAKGNVPACPAAAVVKSRLAHTRIDPKTGEVQILPALPPRLPNATPAALRHYLLNPPDYAKLAKDERAPDEPMSDDDRAEIRLRTAEAEAEAERLRLARMERQEQAERGRAERVEKAEKPRPAAPVAPPVATPPTSNGTHQPTPAATQPTPVTAVNGTAVTQSRQQRLEQLAYEREQFYRLSGLTEPAAKAETWQRVLAKRGVTTARDLSDGQIDDLLGSLRKKNSDLAAAQEVPAGSLAARF